MYGRISLTRTSNMIFRTTLSKIILNMTCSCGTPLSTTMGFVKNGKIVTAIFRFSVPCSDCLFQQSDKLEKRPRMLIVIMYVI